MKISCQSCPAKYTIADEKVLGKIVKIRCKKCGATIVINGNDPEATTVGSSLGAAGADAGGEQWTVNVADGDQRTMTVDEIVQEYKAGVVNEETFCWKDGMNDWLPLREIEELYSACSGGGAMDAGGGDYAPLSMRGNYEQEAPTAAGTPDFGGGALFGGGHEANGNSPAAPLFGAPEPAPAAAPSAARRTAGGRNPGTDLFGGVAQAGGEDDVMTSAGSPPLGGGAGLAAPAADSKLTGQRNENSVLFSLNALTGPAAGAPKPAENKTTATGDGSGLIDIRALSANMAPDTGPKSSKHVDDIMNLGGGGAFSAALAAPVLAPPTADVGSPYGDPGGGSTSSNKTLYAIIGGCAFLAVAAIIITLIIVNKKPDDTASTGPGVTASGTVSAGSTASAAPTDTGTTGSTAPSASAVAMNNSGAKPITPGGSTGGGGGGGAATHTGGGGGGTHAAAGGGGGGGGGSTETTPPPEPAKPRSLAEEMAKATGGTAPAAAPAAATGGSAPFDRGAAAASLGGVNVQSCKKSDGPTGSGHVRVTFQPSGSVSTVDVDQPPFAGSAVGGCVAGKFRSAHVPAFSGAAVTVGKSFTIN